MKRWAAAWGWIRPHFGSLLLALLLALLGAFLQGVIVHVVALMADAADLYRSGGFPLSLRLLRLEPFFEGVSVVLTDAAHAQRALTILLASMVGLMALRGVSAYGRACLQGRVTYKAMTSARNQLHAKLLTLPIGLIAKQRSGDLMTRVVSDVHHLTQSINTFSGALHSIGSAAVFFALMLMNSWTLTLVTLAFTPLIAALLGAVGTAIRRFSIRMQRELSAVANRLERSVAGLKVIKAFGAEGDEKRRFQEETQAMYRTAMRRVRVYGAQGPATELIGALALCGVFGIGCWAVIQGTLTLGGLLAHFGLSALLIDPLRKIGEFHAQFQQGLASIERIEETRALPSEPMDQGGVLRQARGEIEFRNVSFAYDSHAPVLKNVSFKVKAGQTAALVGRSGAGKTTLLQLIPRFYEPTSGEVLIDGEPMRSYSLESLRAHTALAPQETLLFAGTVADNIRMAKPGADDEAVREAARRAHAHAFIESFPEGYETAIGERGARLSGGQAQRLSIARVFLKNPAVFLLDEAMSALDAESEAAVQKSLEELTQTRTAFIIAHRLSTVVNADMIIVLDKGRIVEIGRHDELIQRNGLYKRLCSTFYRKARSASRPNGASMKEKEKTDDE